MTVKQIRRNYKYPRTYIYPSMKTSPDAVEVKRFTRDVPSLDEKRVGKYSFNVQAQYLEIWIDGRGRPKKSDTSEDQSDTKKGNSMVKDTQVKT